MKPRRPARGSIRYYEARWSTATTDECIRDLAKLSYENDRLRARLASLDEILDDMYERIVLLVHCQEQLRSVVEMCLMRVEEPRSPSVVVQWPKNAKPSGKPD